MTFERYGMWDIISFMIKKQDVVRSMMFLKGDKLKNPTIIISFGIILLVIEKPIKQPNYLELVHQPFSQNS